ncbi:hypothetical protein Bca52824_035731 [Brassica carinata]|uniref:Growth-regulating factor n=1 Tax=Brassica carinata TaxID=52824 RepID=A0A8X7S822_BRACI|nr:hypothetical protein Bca52824_035731 [Brassica carinata]
MEIHSHVTTYARNGVLGCYYNSPFTNAQLKELERQAMIYKYMIASVPVPFDLLVLSSSSSARPCNNRNIFGDLEPGRCRRTDGKKWICSREVVSNHKYCERYLHRGRPRSRKRVELPYSRPSNNKYNGGSEKNRDLRKQSLTSIKDKTFEPREVSASLSRYKDFRSFSLICLTSNEDENKYLNFIDIWSDGVRSCEKQSTTTSTPASSSSNGNLSLFFSFFLTGHDKMGLGVIGSGGDDPHGYGPYGVVSSSLDEMSNWLAPLGGPLVEILRPNPSSVFSGDIESHSMTETPSSSPSRVVKKVTGSCLMKAAKFEDLCVFFFPLFLSCACGLENQLQLLVENLNKYYSLHSPKINKKNIPLFAFFYSRSSLPNPRNGPI